MEFYICLCKANKRYAARQDATLVCSSGVKLRNRLGGLPRLVLLPAINVLAGERENITPAGGGRYVGEGKSVDDAVPCQRTTSVSSANKAIGIMSNVTSGSNVGSATVNSDATQTIADLLIAEKLPF